MSFYGIDDNTQDQGGSSSFKAGLNPEVTFERAGLLHLTDDDTKDPLIIFEFSLGESTFKEVMWRINEEQVKSNVDVYPRKARINIKDVDGKTILVPKGEAITAKAAILEEYRNFNKRIKGALSAFPIDKTELKYTAKSYEDYGQWITRITKPFMGSKCWLLLGYNKKDMFETPRYSKFVELCKYGEDGTLFDSDLEIPAKLRLTKETPDTGSNTAISSEAAPAAPSAPVAPSVAAPTGPPAPQV